jgi:hypothetical protein
MLYEKLQDYRKLHEYCWEMPDELARPYTAEEIEEMEEKLKNRGGSKTDTVYDVIKHKKKKMRARVVMDQKANSIADLAAGLLEYADLSALEAPDGPVRREELQILITRANEYKDQNRSIVDEIAALEAQIKPEGDGKTKASQAITDANVVLRKRIKSLRQERQELETAATALLSVRRPLALQIHELTEEIKRAESGVQLERIGVITADHLPSQRYEIEQENLAVQRRNAAAMTALEPAIELRLQREKLHRLFESLPTPESIDKARSLSLQPNTAENVEDQSASETTSGTIELEEASEQANVPSAPKSTIQKRARYLGLSEEHPLYPPSEDIFPIPSSTDLKESNIATLLALLPHLPEMNLLGQPSFTTEGVTVQWADVYDAQFAKEWPNSVKHEHMGIVRHKAPAPADARVYAHGHPVADGPALDLATFKASQWRRTRGVPTESTPVDFAHPKDVRLTAPWLQTDDKEQLENLQARQRAWNSTHFPGRDAEGKRLPPYARSAENSTTSKTKTSYEVAVERKARMDALGAKILAQTLPTPSAGSVSARHASRFIEHIPRIKDQALFETMPGTRSAEGTPAGLAAAAEARKVAEEEAREATEKWEAKKAAEAEAKLAEQAERKARKEEYKARREAEQEARKAAKEERREARKRDVEAMAIEAARKAQERLIEAREAQKRAIEAYEAQAEQDAQQAARAREARERAVELRKASQRARITIMTSRDPMEVAAAIKTPEVNMASQGGGVEAAASEETGATDLPKISAATKARLAREAQRMEAKMMAVVAAGEKAEAAEAEAEAATKKAELIKAQEEKQMARIAAEAAKKPSGEDL